MITAFFSTSFPQLFDNGHFFSINEPDVKELVIASNAPEFFKLFSHIRRTHWFTKHFLLQALPAVRRVQPGLVQAYTQSNSFYATCLVPSTGIWIEQIKVECHIRFASAREAV